MGIPNKDSPIWFSLLHHLLDLDNPDSGGIFDPNRAKELECIAYKSREDMYLKSINLEQPRLSRAGEILIGDLARWRQEFVDHYGDEP